MLALLKSILPELTPTQLIPSTVGVTTKAGASFLISCLGEITSQ